MGKRCVNITDEWWNDMSTTTRQKLLYGIKSGDIWLNKVKYEGTKRIRGNVCLEVYLPSRGTCLLQHVNLGACEFNDIPNAYAQGMSQLCDLHGRTGVGETGEYLDPTIDRQVGLGVLGLANLLRRYGVTYEQFGRALNQFNSGVRKLLLPIHWSRRSMKASRRLLVLLAVPIWSEHLPSLLQRLVATAHRTLMATPVLQKLHHLLVGLLIVTVEPLVLKHMIMVM